MPPVKAICVYCGSSPGHSESYALAAERLGLAIGGAGVRLIYGGGNKGLMGAVARGTMAAGGKATGIIPRFLMEMERSPDNELALDEVVVTDDMHQRKHAMFERADAFVALPGGIGTLEELIEVMTWAQLGRHDKPIAIADLDGFWTPLVALLDHMREAGFVHTANRVRPLVIDDIDAVVPTLLDAVPHAPRGESEIIERM